MEHEYSGLNHHSINDAFYSEHPKLNGPVKVFNHLHYLMGEYSIKTGIAKWQRVIPAAQRDKLERWLGIHYPVPVAVSSF
jgi:hypothetical protein